MAISIAGTGALTVTMTDAEFIQLNGVAAPTIPVTSPFRAIPGLTAASATGTTTLSLPVGSKEPRRVEHLLTILRRGAGTYRISITY